MQLVLFTKVLVDVALIPLLTGDDLAAFQLYARANLAPEPSFVLRLCLAHNTSGTAVVSKAEEEGVLAGPFLLETVRHNE